MADLDAVIVGSGFTGVCILHRVGGQSADANDK